jgi:hypothetical protein
MSHAALLASTLRQVEITTGLTDADTEAGIISLREKKLADKAVSFKNVLRECDDAEGI